MVSLKPPIYASLRTSDSLLIDSTFFTLDDQNRPLDHHWDHGYRGPGWYSWAEDEATLIGPATSLSGARRLRHSYSEILEFPSTHDTPIVEFYQGSYARPFASFSTNELFTFFAFLTFSIAIGFLAWLWSF